MTLSFATLLLTMCVAAFVEQLCCKSECYFARQAIFSSVLLELCLSLLKLQLLRIVCLSNALLSSKHCKCKTSVKGGAHTWCMNA